MLRIREIIAILDASHARKSQTKVPFIERAIERGQIENLTADEVKSYVITQNKIYTSPISSMTLKKRVHESQ
ncbi:DUF370 domain-containing protein [Hazenella sp. IB182357]|uniref:DUF370 domain-containing protein n=2 Tax=Polycladospora coralii TaxID=2771432 RepID=A0A926RTP8_9BACL|nr:DUF370 domain-containing protein [Polycladospora coralii]MBS7530472.1 DUF370 domain-containing protein [Polycladospora coralii]